MVDTVTITTAATSTMGNDNDDWEVAVDTGEFDKRHEQQEKARASNQESTPPAIVDDDSRNNTSFNIMNLNKPIRILKRPTSQSHLSTNNDVSNSLIAPSQSTNSATMASSSSNHDNNTNDCSSSSSHNNSSSTTVPVISIIPRNQTKDSINSSESITTPVFSSTTTASSQSAKPAIKTYEQRELEYRLARLRIMGEEESSAKDDDDDDIPTVEATPLSTDDNTKTALSSTTRSTNKMNGFSQIPLQCHSTPGSYASDLYTLNTIPSNTGTIHFTPNNNTNNNSTPNLGTGPFSSPNFPQHYRNTYTGPYSHLLPNPPGVPRYPIPATTTTTLYMTSTAPFISAPTSSVSSSYHYPLQQHPNLPTNNWYHYQRPQTPYGAQQYGHPQ